MNGFPALGFHPARGNVGSVRQLATQMTDTGKYAREAHEVLRSIQDKKEVWTGEAAKAFTERLGELPGYLDDAHLSLRQAGKALSTWGDQLEAHQRHAQELEQQARQALAAAEQADTAAQAANARANTPIAYDANDPAAAQAAQRQAQANAAAATRAIQAADQAWAKVEEIRRQAENLRDRWQDNARVCEEALRRAAEYAPDKGILESIGDAFGAAADWVMNNLGAVGDIAGMVSAVAGALALIPVMAPIAGPIALAAGGVALLAHGGEMVKDGKWTDPTAWVGLGTDLLGVLPGVGAAARGMAMTTDGLQLADGITPALMVGGRQLLAEAASAEPAKLVTALGKQIAGAVGGNGDIIARAVQGTFNVGIQGPVLGDLLADDDTSQNIKDGSGYVAGAGGAVQSVGEWGKASSGIGKLADSVSDFVKALG